ncbi:MAG: NHL repeat-containing protein [Candidatus Acidiferrales bacterium]
MRILAGLCLLASFAGCAFGQYDGDLTATKRIFPGVGPGLRAVKRGVDGNYYVLASPGSSASVFDPAGKLIRRVPAYGDSKEPSPQSPQLAAITFGEDLDVDVQGTVYVADRGANAIKIWDTKGNARMFKIDAPVSVASLPDGEVAVATMREQHLVIVFDKTGRDVREFGDPEPISDRPELNRFLNIGMLVTDGGGHLYYAFPYLPEATVRQYDRYGYGGQDIQYTGVDAWPAAQATRKEIARQEQRGEPPVFKRILTAVGVERSSGEVWMALGDKLLHFDKDGNRRATYLIYTPEGARLEANTILIDKDHLIIGSDPLGIYEFVRPDKKTP